MKLNLALLLLCLCGITACDNKKAELNQAYDELGACLDKVIAESPTPTNMSEINILLTKELDQCIEYMEKVHHNGGNANQFVKKKNDDLNVHIKVKCN
ncbi:MAG: hypothetical protein IJV35_05870 [Neisseriaceae bacterium]|nr:hypothetical protein [Neisseriaceae bacterium]